MLMFNIRKAKFHLERNTDKNFIASFKISKNHGVQNKKASASDNIYMKVFMNTPLLPRG